MFYYDGVHCFKRLNIDQNTDYHIISTYYSWEIITVVFVVIIFLLIMIILRFITCTLFQLIETLTRVQIIDHSPHLLSS